MKKLFIFILLSVLISSLLLTTSQAAFNIDAIPDGLYNGNNYFKLRDLAGKIDFTVTWDGKTNSIGIDTTNITSICRL